MNKRQILDLPKYPSYKEELEDNVITFSSTVYLHNDRGSTVDIYLIPVQNTYIINSNYNKAIFRERHLLSCLRASKYISLTIEMVEELPWIDSILKGDPEFLHKLHYMYP